MLAAFSKRGIVWIGAVAAVTVATGCAFSSGRPSRPPRVSAAARVPGSFFGVTPAGPSRLAVYSSASGRPLKLLTAALPGGGVGELALSADGRAVAFSRGTGTCASEIDTLPVSGGRERVLIPMTGSAGRFVVPGLPSYSADGRYLLYETVPCSGLTELLHLRNLRLGRGLARTGHLAGEGAVFVNHDRQIAYVAVGGRLAVRRVPSFRERSYAPPRNCRYQALAGTETTLVATLQCGTRHVLSLVAVSPRTFAITRRLISLGSCRASFDVSLAVGDPSAILAETFNACGPPQQQGGFLRILEIIGHTARLVSSGRAQTMPVDVVW